MLVFSEGKGRYSEAYNFGYTGRIETEFRVLETRENKVLVIVVILTNCNFEGVKTSFEYCSGT